MVIRIYHDWYLGISTTTQVFTCLGHCRYYLSLCSKASAGVALHFRDLIQFCCRIWWRSVRYNYCLPSALSVCREEIVAQLYTTMAGRAIGRLRL